MRYLVNGSRIVLERMEFAELLAFVLVEYELPSLRPFKMEINLFSLHIAHVHVYKEIHILQTLLRKMPCTLF